MKEPTSPDMEVRCLPCYYFLHPPHLQYRSPVLEGQCFLLVKSDSLRMHSTVVCFFLLVFST